jgi:hypothetical protein
LISKDKIRVAKMEQFLKAYIQSFNDRVMNDQLTLEK